MSMNEIKDRNDHLFKTDFKQYFRILIEQKLFIIIFCLSAVLSSLAFTYVTSEKYIAAVAIYYRPVDTSMMYLKDKQVFGAPAPNPPFKVIPQTLSDIIRSEVILRPVVETLGLDKSLIFHYAIWYERWYHSAKEFTKEYLLKLWTILKYGRLIEEDPTVAAIMRLRENIDIKATKDSYVYILSVKDKFPERAARTVDVAGYFLVTWLKEQDINPNEGKLYQFQGQLDNKEVLLTELRKKREDLLISSSLVSVDEETEKGVKSLYELKKEYIDISSEIERKNKKLSALAQEIQNKGKKYTNPDDLKRMESERRFEEIELKGLNGKAVSLESSISDMKKRLQEMLALKKKVEDIEMKIHANTQEYLHLKDLYLQALSQARTSDSEVKVMHRAETPSKPSQPIKIYHVGLTFVSSLFFSIGLVYVFAFFDIRIFFAPQGKQGPKDNSQF